MAAKGVLILNSNFYLERLTFLLLVPFPVPSQYNLTKVHSTNSISHGSGNAEEWPAEEGDSR